MRTIWFRLAALSMTALLLCASQALAADGAALYKEKCSGCHGLDGKADSASAKAMKVPPLAGKALTPEEVVKRVRASERHKAVTSKLSDEALSAIAGAIPQ
jgi:mono/diheme cytochrome c family protein